MINLAKKLFPICRSLTGNGNRKTLKILKNEVPELTLYEISSGKKFYDWVVPDEWNIKDAYIASNGKKIIDFKKNNLHIVGYSIPFNGKVKKKELLKKLHTLPNQKNAIPYVTSYYKKDWGFCVSYNDLKKKFKSKEYQVVINSTLKRGSLTFADCIIKGKSKKEILISCNICHPSMASNEVSGMVVAINFIKNLKKIKDRHYTYRIVFVPETLGSIIYINKNFINLKKKVIAGFVLTCMGDDNEFSYLPSRSGNKLSDRSAINYFNFNIKKFNKYTYLDRGSDERQYCSPGVDLPVCSIMRSKYNTYPEYHTSLDNLNFISEKGLRNSLQMLESITSIIENNFKYKSTYKCEPKLGPRNLYPKISSKNLSPLSNSKKNNFINYLNFLAYADGKNDLIDISEKIGVGAFDLIEIKNILLKEKLITK
jgi:aminopeptidase-like protein